MCGAAISINTLEAVQFVCIHLLLADNDTREYGTLR